MTVLSWLSTYSIHAEVESDRKECGLTRHADAEVAGRASGLCRRCALA